MTAAVAVSLAAGAAAALLLLGALGLGAYQGERRAVLIDVPADPDPYAARHASPDWAWLDAKPVRLADERTGEVFSWAVPA